MDSNPSEAKKKIEELRDYASVNLDQIRETIHEIGSETDILLTIIFLPLLMSFQFIPNTKVDLRRNR